MMIIFYQVISQKYSGEINSPFRPIFSPQNIAKNSYKYCTTIPTFFQRKNMNIAANLRTSYSGALVGFSLLTASQKLRGDPFRLCRNMWSPLRFFIRAASYSSQSLRNALTICQVHLGNICRNFISKCSPNFPRLLRTRRLFSSLLLRFDFSLHFHDQHGELFLAFLSRLCVDVS